MKSKPFPITQGIPCQLKWNHSTVFLTMGTTASCHRVTHDPYELRGGQIEFHNIRTKLEAREKMLRGEWPGRGCEHCKSTEDAGGHSDRMSSLTMPGVTAPKELKTNKKATSVTPTQLEIYFSNTCNLKCIYCNSKFSSTIDNENRIHGEFLETEVGNPDRFGKHVWLPGKINVNPNIQADTDKLFSWLEQNIHELNKIMILGGEPFLQKETEKMIQLLERGSTPKLTLVIFSNLTVDPARVQMWLARMWRLVEKGTLHNLQVVGSLDCWGPQAEYVRNGLDLNKYVDNMEFILTKTKITPSVNSAMTALTIPTLPDLIRQINTWSRIREVYWSGMKAGDAGRPYLNPTIFGRDILPLGIDRAIDVYETNGDPIKEAQLNNLKGIRMECEKTEPDRLQQKLLKVYLKELDRRRGTDYTKLFPTIDKLLES
jgi:MoaA/NifB/PqqE/SkfB family radical SAM enzyme